MTSRASTGDACPGAHIWRYDSSAMLTETEDYDSMPPATDWLAEFGLDGVPFAEPPGVFIAGDGPARTLDALVEACGATRPVTVLTAPRAGGLTTALEVIAQRCRDQGRTAVLLGADDRAIAPLPQRVLHALGLGDIAGDGIDIQNILRVFLLNECARGRAPVLILDDAHHYDPRELAGLSGLLKLQYQGVSAVKLMLSGPASLDYRLEAPELAPLAARCTAAYRWPALTRTEFRRWVNMCLQKVGAARPVVTGEALDAVYRLSAGLPGIASCVLVRGLQLAALAGESQLCARGIARIASVLPLREAAEQPSPTLTLRLGGRTVSSQQVVSARLLLGRDPDADIVLGDDWVSRYHALLIFDAQGAWLADLASTNGTHVNGRPITRQRLGHGDVIRIGQYAIELNWRGAAAVGEPDDTASMRLFPQAPMISSVGAQKR